MLTKEIKLKRDTNIISREEEDVGFLFHPDTGRINILNHTGRFIWSRLDGENSRENILNEMLKAFEVADKQKLAVDFDHFILDLRKWGMLEGAINNPTVLTNVCLGITSRCNLSCRHCLNRNITDSDPDMTTEEIFRVIDQLGNSGVIDVSIFGGEPLAHPDFRKIVEYLQRYPISVSLNTNATLIDRAMAKWLKSHGIPGACVSFDGSSPKVMDKIRGGGAFAACLKGIEALKSENMSVLLSVTLNKINYQDIKEMVLLGKKIGGDTIRFNHVFFSGNATCFLKDIYLEPDGEKEAIEAVWQVSQEFGNFISSSSSYLCQKKKLREMKNHQPAEDKIVVYPCGAAGNKCAIRPDGWVVPCEIIWEVKCGNVKREPLRDIWKNSQMMDSFRKTQEIDLNEIPECKGCHYQYLCFQGHRCYPYYYPGGIKNRTLYCWLKKEKGFS